jgi:hypothetical protein
VPVEASDDHDSVYLRMSRDEALVLFDWVHRHEDADVDLSQVVSHPAERETLWAISAALEKLLVEPFRNDYGDVVKRARDRISSAE